MGELNFQAFKDEFANRIKMNNGVDEWDKLCKEGFDFSMEQAKKAWAKKDVFGVMCMLGNTYHLTFVCDNFPLLKKCGVYEKALLHAFTMTRTNHAGWQPSVINFLFGLADREKLRQEGDPLPGDGPFTVYRGVAGRGARRRLRGISWTASLEKGIWFAKRFAEIPDMVKPMVYQTTVELAQVYAYDNGRQEQEFLCDIPHDLKLKKVWP